MKLAINGGEKVRKNKFPGYNTIGEEEKTAVMQVLESGNLSDFLGCWHHISTEGQLYRNLKKNGQNILMLSMRYPLTRVLPD